MEAIIAIAVCGSGLAMILGLYGMAIKTEMASQNIFEQSIEINSIADDINLCLKDGAANNIDESVTWMLKTKYPNYELTEVSKDSHISLYKLVVLHKNKNGIEKLFHIKVFWRPDE